MEVRVAATAEIPHISTSALLQVIFEFIYVLSFDLRIRKTMMNDHRLPTILYNNMSKEGMQHIAKWCLKLVNA